MRCYILTLVLFAAAAPVSAQDFTPPSDPDALPTRIKVGLFGFSSRLGVDFRGPNQAVASMAVDVADLYTDRVRVRPSFEIGAGGGGATYVANLEVMYRFLPDRERAIPYVGFGVGVFGQPNCGPNPNCPQAMVQFALGFEIRFQNNMNWLIEYHGEDALRRHRFFIGLATRRS